VTVDESRKLVVRHEEFCQNPGKFYGALIESFNEKGCSIGKSYNGESAFGITRGKVQDEKLSKALGEFQKREW
jgi:hypothetical protein